MGIVLVTAGCALIGDADLEARFDLDRDGVSRPDDCDDADPDVGAAGEWYADADQDGVGAGEAVEACAAPSGFVATAGDCDDTDSAVLPGVPETCDGVDDDCDGATDEDDATDAPTWYRDADGDDFGVTEDSMTACSQPVGYSAVGGDCDDADVEVNPSVREVCDGRDEDCSGTADDPHWYLDADSDGYGTADDYAVACEAPAGRVESDEDCDDADAAVNPGATEVCDAEARDEDCDGVADDDDASVVGTTAWYGDADADGYGDPGDSISACVAPEGAVAVGGDCDDTDAGIHPGAEETWYDGIDGDCAGDDDHDADADGFRSTDSGGEDCDDADPWVNPDATEACGDEIDNDCDGESLGSCALSGELSLAEAHAILAGGTESRSGDALADGRDADGDGLADLAIGAPYYHTSSGGEAGAAHLVLGAGLADMALTDAALTATTYSAARFGSSVVLADTDGDGLTEFFVGAPDAESPEGVADAGALYRFDAGMTGTVNVGADEAVCTGSTTYDRMGTVLAAGDVDADGVEEVLASEGYDFGVAVLDGSGLGEVRIAADWIGGGTRMASGQDVTGDGVHDVVFSPGSASQVYLLAGPLDTSGELAALGYLVEEEVRNDGLSAIAFAGDTDRDGYGDLVLGASQEGSGGTNAGAAYVLAGPFSGTPLLSDASAKLLGSSYDSAGRAVSSAGDVDRDGTSDLLVGFGAGAYVVLSPRSGTVDLSTADGTLQAESSADNAGSPVAPAGDVDADGFDDIMVAAPYRDAYAGAVYVFLGGTP